MRVEAITPVVTDDVSGIIFLKAAGILKKTTIDGVAFQKELRKEREGVFKATTLKTLDPFSTP